MTAPPIRLHFHTESLAEIHALHYLHFQHYSTESVTMLSLLLPRVMLELMVEL
jgi:hypothetical protein